MAAATTCAVYSYDALAAATNGWAQDRVVGRGGFGRVYRAELDGRPVAVKRLQLGGGGDGAASQQGATEFLQEIAVAVQVRHLNLLPLVGVAITGSQRCLVYPLMTGGNVEERLSRPGQAPLTPLARIWIALGVARGLLALHTVNRVHRDVKCSNVLLDEQLTPKLSDMGIARTVGPKQTAYTRYVKGTDGYLDPEYAQTGELSLGSDVYSFGIVLLELLTSARARGVVGFLDKYKEDLQHGRFQALADRSLKWRRGVADTLGSLARRCLLQSARLRPTMAQLLRVLEPWEDVARPAVAEGGGGADAELGPTSPTGTPLVGAGMRRSKSSGRHMLAEDSTTSLALGEADGTGAAGATTRGRGAVTSPSMTPAEQCPVCGERQRVGCGHVMLCSECIAEGEAKSSRADGRTAGEGMGAATGSVRLGRVCRECGMQVGDAAEEDMLLNDIAEALLAPLQRAYTATPMRGCGGGFGSEQDMQLPSGGADGGVQQMCRGDGPPLEASAAALSQGARQGIEAIGTAAAGARDWMVQQTGLVGALQSLRETQPGVAVAVARGLGLQVLDASSDGQGAAAGMSQQQPQSGPPSAQAVASLLPLVQLLIAEDEEGKDVAAGVIAILAMESAEARSAMGSSGALDGLVNLLRGSSSTGCETAAIALCNLALQSAENQQLIARLGAVEPLVRLMRNGSDSGTDAALRCLRNVTAAGSREVQEAALHAGAVQQLLNVMRDKQQRPREIAAGVLWNLVSHPEVQSEMVASGVVPLLVRELREGSRRGRIAAAGVLQAIASKNKANKELILTSGAVAPLVAGLRGDAQQPSDSGVAAAAAGVLCNLAADSQSAQSAIAAAGAIEALVAMLRKGDETQLGPAAGALLNLIVSHEENMRSLVEAGAVEPLATVLRDGSPGAQLAAARALGKLAAHRSLRSAVSGATVIGAIVHLLRSGSFAARESAAVTLAALAADSRESQMCIAKAGAIPLLSSLIRDVSPGARVAASQALFALATHPDLRAEAERARLASEPCAVM